MERLQLRVQSRGVVLHVVFVSGKEKHCNKRALIYGRVWRVLIYIGGSLHVICYQIGYPRGFLRAVLALKKGSRPKRFLKMVEN